MKIIIVCDSFKESLSALEVGQQIEAGFREIYPRADYITLPAADGGEGTVDAIIAATAGRRITRLVTGPLGERVEASYALTDNGHTAVIEMAAAAGLMLVPLQARDPSRTTSFGVGELIIDALDHGARRLLIGLGGSATNDAGAGLLQALGVSLTNAEGRELGPGGASLSHLHNIDISRLDPRLGSVTIEAACDVDSPLIGPHGASAVYGPQKGADAAMVSALDAALTNFAQRVKSQFGTEIATLRGGGAAGGLGATLSGFLNASLRPGVDIVMDAIGLDQRIADADLVITGEGRIDRQTIHGKTPIGVSRIAKRHGKPVIAIAGSLGDGCEEVLEHGIDAIFSILNRPCSLHEAFAEATTNLKTTSRNIAAATRMLWAGPGSD